MHFNISTGILGNLIRLEQGNALITGSNEDSNLTFHLPMVFMTKFNQQFYVDTSSDLREIQHLGY